MPTTGLGVTCTADHPGLYGWVKDKRTGAAIESAIVNVAGFPPVSTDDKGFWSIAGATGGPHRIVVVKLGFSPAEAVNVRVPPFGLPAAGIQVDTALEPSFLLQTGVTYKTFIDYSRGRTILHVVTVDVTRAPITLGKVPQQGSDFQPLLDVATAQGAPVLVERYLVDPGVSEQELVKVIGENRCEEQDGTDVQGQTRDRLSLHQRLRQRLRVARCLCGRRVSAVGGRVRLGRVLRGPATWSAGEPDRHGSRAPGEYRCSA